MDESFFDRLFYHLAQQNYEECYRIHDSLDQDHPFKKVINRVVNFDMMYYTFTHVTFKDANRDAILKDFVEEVFGILKAEKKPMYEEFFQILTVKLKMSEIYKECADSDYSLPLSLERNCHELINHLENLQNYELSPYKETLILEISAMQNLLLAFQSLSKFNYMSTIIALTKAHYNLEQWTNVFFHKKYSPQSYSNSTTEYNLLYKYMVHILHSLIAKSTLYFDRNLANVYNKELLDYGYEYVTR